MNDPLQFITLNDAAVQSGRTPIGFRRWLLRFTEAHPEIEIRRLKGRIEKNDLNKALQVAAEDFEVQRKAKSNLVAGAVKG